MATAGSNENHLELPFRGVENDTSAYLPLDPTLKEIRCIALLPGSFDDTVTCELVYTSLHEHLRVVNAISYTALSYCWGDIDDTIEIQLRCPLSKPVIESTEVTGPVQYNVARLASDYTITEFKVTRNLHAALQKIRQDFDINDTSIRYFWIDALCISQSNPREKSHQVGLMGEIFSSASSVLVWLGPEDKYSRIFCWATTMCLRPVLSQFVNINRRYEHDTRLEWAQVAYHIVEDMLRNHRLNELLREVLEQPEISSTPPQNDRGWQCWQTFLCSFNSILARPWWSRIWVLQEVLLAPRTHRGALRVDIRIGGDTLHWQDAIDAMRTIDELGELGSVYRSASLKHVIMLFRYDESDFSNFAWFRMSWWTPTRTQTWKRPTMLDLLERTKHFHATDPRDKIFALLQLASNTVNTFVHDPLINPDYTKSITSVICDFVRWQIRESLSLRVLINPDVTDRSIREIELPSWAPDVLHSEAWTRQLRAVFQERPQHRFETGSGTAVSDYLQLSTISTVSSRHLSLTGFRISRIKAAISDDLVFASDTELLNVLVRGKATELLFYLYQCCKDHVTAETGSSLIYGILQMLGMLVPPPGWRAYCVVNIAETSAWVRDSGVLTGQFIDWHGDRGKEDIKYLRAFVRDFWRFKNRRIFSTTDGSTALAHKDARPNDLIVALHGGTTPFVLQSKGGTTYRLLSPCFFFAKKWMDGEPVRYKKENNISDERFDLE